MIFYTYIIYSSSKDQYYIGHSGDLEDRLYRHNNSGSKSTKQSSDWELKYQKEFNDRAGAATHEMEIKKKKSRKYIEQPISSAGYLHAGRRGASRGKREGHRLDSVILHERLFYKLEQPFFFLCFYAPTLHTPQINTDTIMTMQVIWRTGCIGTTTQTVKAPHKQMIGS